ncbi:MAG: hypothetical protein AB1796_08590 [Bacillota bacterium]
MSISKTRGLLYSIARLLGDFQAIFFQRRPVPDREKSSQESRRQGCRKSLSKAVQII